MTKEFLKMQGQALPTFVLSLVAVDGCLVRNCSGVNVNENTADAL